MTHFMPAKSQYCRACLMVVVSTITTLAAASTLAATQQFTYRFVEGQDRPLRWGGGITDIDVRANLLGSFDLDIEDDGSSTITRFDVLLVDLLEQGATPSGLPEGLPLPSLLYVDPIGLGGAFDGSTFIIGPMDLVFNMPVTRITLTPNSATSALFTIRSHSHLLDGPDTATDSQSILVQLVPEPTAASLALMMIGVALLSRGFRQRG